MLAQIFSNVKRFQNMQKIDILASILDPFSCLYSICMNLEKFLNKKLPKDDVSSGKHCQI